MSNFLKGAMEMGAAQTLTNRKGKLAHEAHAKMAEAAAQKPQGAWEKNKGILHDKDYERMKENDRNRTVGEEMGDEIRKKRDKDKVYFGQMDADAHKQFGRTAISSKKRREEVHGTDSDSDLDSDDLEMLNDPELEKLQRNRLAKIKAEFMAKKALKAGGHGRYEYMDEKDMLKMAAKTDYVVVSFDHKDFERCKIIDHHLGALARKHMGTRFVKLDALKSPFMVQKMRIKTMPSICIFIDAVLVDKVIGFEDMGGKDDFPTVVLENRLVKSGVIPDKHGRRVRRSKKTQTLLDTMAKGEFYDDELDM